MRSFQILFLALIAVATVDAQGRGGGSCVGVHRSVVSRNSTDSTIRQQTIYRMGQNTILRHESYRFEDYQVDIYHPETVGDHFHQQSTKQFSGTGPESAEPQHSGLALFESVINSSVNLAVKSYIDRRNWSENFVEQLKDIAHKYASWSTYVTVKDLQTEGQPVVGTIRFISAPYTFAQNVRTGQVLVGNYDRAPETLVARPETGSLKKSLLPMEEILGIQLDRPAVNSPWTFTLNNGDPHRIGAGVMTEPGNFVITKGLHDSQLVLSLLAAECYTYLFRQAPGMTSLIPGWAGSAPTLVTYGDPLSQRMYRSISFHALENIQLGPEHISSNYRVLATNPSAFAAAFVNSPVNRKLVTTHIAQLKAEADQVIEHDLFPFEAWNSESSRFSPRLSTKDLKGR